MRHHSSTTMWPLSIFTPSSSSPSPSTLPVMPMARMTRSATISSAVAVRFRQRGGDAVRAFDEPLDARAGMDDDALPGEGLARELGDLGILGGKDAGQHLDHRHLGAEAAIEARELDADGAGADDEQRFGKALRHHRLLVGPDQPSVRLEPRQRARPRAGGEDDVLGLDVGQRLATRADHGDAPLPSQPRRSLDHLDLVLAHEIGDAVRQPLGDFAAALDHARQGRSGHCRRRARTRRRAASRCKARRCAAAPWSGCSPS